MTYTLHPDGSFDLAAGPVRLRNCYPCFDGQSVRATAVRVAAGSVTYALAGGELALRFGTTADGAVTVDATLGGGGRAPFRVQPLAGRVEGATRLFRQGLGFSGPTGVVDLDDKPYDSYYVTALLAPHDGGAVAIGADGHRDYLQQTTVSAKQYRRGLTSRHVEATVRTVEAGFVTEGIPIPAGGLRLPTVYVRAGAALGDVLAAAARAVATEMRCRTHHPPRFHWCSWYERGPNLTLADLRALLDGLQTVEPPAPFQTIQIDAGYCPSLGDWLTPRADVWPGGLRAAFDLIRDRGYSPGVWIGPFMVGSRSDLFRDHPDWVIRGHDGRPVPEWRRYDASGTPGHIDEEFYALDASRPGVEGYLRHVFVTLREWGATFFKTDFLDWGLKDTAHVRRHNPAETSVQSFRRVMRAVRESIGEDAYWLGCIAPYGPMLGFADGMRVANDVNHSASEGGTGNMLTQTYFEQYFNNVWWQNDPDVFFLRGHHIEMEPAYLEALAYWHGILGGSVNTSDAPHKLPPDRQALLRFVRPGGDRARSARVPLLGRTRKLLVLVRDYGGDLAPRGHAALVLNPTREAVTERFAVRDLVGRDTAHAFRWGATGSTLLGPSDAVVAELGPRSGMLVYLSPDGAPPPANLRLAE